MAIPRFPVYVFDVDGTLVDSAPDIAGAVQQVMARHTSEPLPFEYIRSFIGFHLDAIFMKHLPHYTREQLDEMIADYRTTYWALEHAGTTAFPGALEAVSTLGGRKSTATTKGTPTTKIVLEKFGFLPYFEHVQGTDGFPAKPEPDVILRSMAGLNAKPEECLMIGDSPADMEAGRRAGVKICAVRYGYGSEADLARFEPDYWVSDLRELL